jgi:putative polyhydroxyalkanoate system protein
MLKIMIKKGTKHSMADILIKKNHDLDPEELKKRLKPAIENVAKTYGIIVRWHEKGCQFTGPAKGCIKIGDDYIKMEARLGFMAMLLKGSIEKEIEKILRSVLS